MAQATPKAQKNRRVGILFLALLLPPVAVYLEAGLRKQFWINIVLTLLGFFPGMIHAVFIFLKPQ